MKPLNTAPPLLEQVRDAIVDAIAAGRLAPGERIVQEQLAQTLGVSRQPVQQALALLREQGLLREAGARGLVVAPLEPDDVQHIYELRAALEGLAARRAAAGGRQRAARQGAALIDAGRRAVASGSLARMVAADRRFHEFLYELSGNPLVGLAMARHWPQIERVMGEVLHRDERPRDIWDQHAGILQAVAEGDADRAEALARAHIGQAAEYMTARLRAARGTPAD